MLGPTLSRIGIAARILPVVGLMSTFVSVAPALAASSAASPGPLSISQSADGPALIGQPETFVITVTNTTAGPANDVFLGDALPAGASLVGALPNPNFCVKSGAGGGPAFACFVGTLGPAGSGSESFSITFTLVARTPSIDNRAATTGFAGGSFVTNSVGLVRALSAGAITPPTTSSATDVQVTGFASTGSPTAGSTFGYVFQVKNNGPQLASSVTFSDTLPAGEGYLGAISNSGTCSQNAGVVSCSLGDLAVGATALVGIGVTAPTGLALGAQAADTATVASATPDSNLNNNSVTVNVKVQ